MEGRGVVRRSFLIHHDDRPGLQLPWARSLSGWLSRFPTSPLPPSLGLTDFSPPSPPAPPSHPWCPSQRCPPAAVYNAIISPLDRWTLPTCWFASGRGRRPCSWRLLSSSLPRHLDPPLFQPALLLPSLSCLTLPWWQIKMQRTW